MSTMCIIHKGSRGFRALSHASIFGGNLIGLKTEIPYEIIHSTLRQMQKQPTKFKIVKAIKHFIIFEIKDYGRNKQTYRANKKTLRSEWS